MAAKNPNQISTAVNMASMVKVIPVEFKIIDRTQEKINDEANIAMYVDPTFLFFLFSNFFNEIPDSFIHNFPNNGPYHKKPKIMFTIAAIRTPR